MTRFHVGLHSADLGRSVRFYRALLGAEPTKNLPDYVRFESAEPPLVLVARAAGAGGVTVIVTGTDTPVVPPSSVARAVSAYVPAGTLLHVTAYGASVSRAVFWMRANGPTKHGLSERNCAP